MINMFMTVITLQVTLKHIVVQYCSLHMTKHICMVVVYALISFNNGKSITYNCMLFSDSLNLNRTYYDSIFAIKLLNSQNCDEQKCLRMLLCCKGKANQQ